MALFLGTLKCLDQSGDEPECTFYISLQAMNLGCTWRIVQVEDSKEKKRPGADILLAWSKASLCLGWRFFTGLHE